MTSHRQRPIALIGLMGAGKSAVARALGERLGCSVADLDAMIEGAEGLPVAEVFAQRGESHFRRLEGVLLAQVLRAGVRVIACGGGIVLDPARRRLLRERCHVVWLEVSPAEAAGRVTAHGDAGATRPLLAGHDPRARLETLLADRASLYAEVAHARVRTDGRTPDDVAARVLESERAAA
jgi:shikimate kinase